MNLSGIRRLRDEGKKGTLFVLRATKSEPVPSTINQRNLTQSFLCHECRTSDLHGLFTWNRAEPLWDLVKVMSQERCDFCRLLYQLAIEDYGVSELGRLAARRVSIRLERCNLWEYKYRGGVVGRRITILSLINPMNLPLASPMESFLHLVDTSRTHSELYRHEDPEGLTCILPLGQGSPNFGLSPRTTVVDVDLVKNWLETCNQSHGTECWEKPKVLDVPRYLIDLKRNCITRNLGKSGLRYLALSYVWGNFKQPTLTTGNLVELQKKGALLKLALPHTIRDAMTLTIDIGERYLWIDSLCIVQDDSVELLSQIEKMNVVYRQAYVTIIAASGSDSDSGLCGVRNSPAIRTPQEVTAIGSMQLSTLHVKPHGELRKSVWNSRGWTFQEEICSSRRLVFTTSMVTFNCMAATWREDFPERLMMNNRERYSYLYTSFISGQSFSEEEKEDIMRWYSVILQNYLSRDLTNASDILKAFAGVTSLVTNVLGHSIWGLPGNYMYEALCWKTDDNAGTPTKRRLGFPSWSWAGWYHSKYRADQSVFHLVPRENGVNLRPVVQFVNLSKPHQIWPSTLLPLHDHFCVNSTLAIAKYQQKCLPHLNQGHHLGFFTSATCLQVDLYQARQKKDSIYRLTCPVSKKLVGMMLAHSSIVQYTRSIREFVVVGLVPRRTALFEDIAIEVGDLAGPDANGGPILHDEHTNELDALHRDSRVEDSFILLMIEKENGVSVRKAITKLVPSSRWWMAEPHRSMVILG